MAMSDAYPDPTTHPEAEGFLRAIAEAPEDGLPKHIMADWLQENGYDNASRGMRWAAKYGKHPGHTEEEPDGTLRSNESGWLPNLPSFGLQRPWQHNAHARIPDAIVMGHRAATNHFAYGPGFFQQSNAADAPKSHVQHWKVFLRAADNSRFDENNEPLSRFKENQIGYQSDLDHPGRAGQ